MRRGRCYIPFELIGTDEIGDNYLDYFRSMDTKNFCSIMKECYEYTNNYLEEGKKILKEVHSFKLRLEVGFIIYTARRVFNKIKKMEADILNVRPVR